MRISEKSWDNYIKRLAAINSTAAKKMQAWMNLNPNADKLEIISRAYALTTSYGEAAGALACELYDEIATIEKAGVKPAVPADPPSYKYIEKAVGGTIAESPARIPELVGRMVKQTGADTTLQNAKRDGAYFAWVPHGDTCAFCLTLASNGWQKASDDTVKGKHADHIHNNCNCEFAISFNGQGEVEGYDWEKYRRIYDGLSGDSSDNKINNLRKLINGNPPLTIDQVDFIIQLENDTSILATKSPKEWKSFLDDLGFNVLPLGQGSLKGILFEDGGGFRIFYRGDGYFQYHSGGGHHGKDPYYKVSSAKRGILRLNLDGSVRNE